jgi:nucleoside 2-deoxyribosyltransferase
MKIYLAHSREFDFANELYQPIQSSELFQKHSWILPHVDNSFINSKEVIQNSDLVIAEVSYPSTGLGIELGWAESFGKKLICFYKENSKISSSLNSVCSSFIEYENSEDLVQKLLPEIES